MVYLTCTQDEKVVLLPYGLVGAHLRSEFTYATVPTLRLVQWVRGKDEGVLLGHFIIIERRALFPKSPTARLICEGLSASSA